MAGRRASIIRATSKTGFLRIAGKTVGTSEGIFLRYPGKREWLTREARQQYVMRRDVLADMLGRLFIAHATFMAQRDIADIRVEVMRIRVTIPVGFIGADRVFVPLTGEDALSADGFKSVSNAPIPANRSIKRKA